MRIAVVGTGGVGGYFGGKLVNSGTDVVFVARGKHLEALRSRPLRVESIGGDFEVPVRVATNAAEAGNVDVIIVAVKAWQVPEAGRNIRPLLRDHTVVLPLQNGIEAPEQLADVVGERAVIGGLCKIIAFVVEPGVVRHAGADPFVAFGRLHDNTPDKQLEALQLEFTRAGITCEIAPDIRAAMWQKLLFIGPLSGVGAVTGLPIGAVRSEHRSRAQLEHAMHEVVAVAASCGVRLPSDAVEKTLSYVDSLPADGTSSLQRDIMQGRPSELEAQIGVIARLGRRRHVATPQHDSFYAKLKPMEDRARHEGPDGVSSI